MIPCNIEVDVNCRIWNLGKPTLYLRKDIRTEIIYVYAWASVGVLYVTYVCDYIVFVSHICIVGSVFLKYLPPDIERVFFISPSCECVV